MAAQHDSPRDAELADAFRDMESGVNDLEIMADILLLIRNDMTEGKLSRLDFAVTHAAEMMKRVKLNYHATFDKAVEKSDSPLDH